MSDDIDLTDDEYDTFMAVLAEQRCQHSHADTACPPPPERAILADLIAELRELATCDIDLGNQTDPKTLAFLLDRAEARLREVGDE